MELDWSRSTTSAVGFVRLISVLYGMAHPLNCLRWMFRTRQVADDAVGCTLCEDLTPAPAPGFMRTWDCTPRAAAVPFLKACGFPALRVPSALPEQPADISRLAT